MTPVVPKHQEPSTSVPSDSIQILTWYMADAVSFASLVQLVTTHSLYTSTVQKLELVVPSAADDKEVDALVQWMETSPTLQEVVLWTLPQNASNKLLVQRLEHVRRNKALGSVCYARKQMPNDGSLEFLCDSLSPDETSRLRRHLALDGTLLQNSSTAELEQLAFDMSWDRSIHVLLCKDVSNPHLQIVLPSLVQGPLHTLKITYHPNPSNERRLPDGKRLSTALLKGLLSSPQLHTLKRLYLGHVRFGSDTTRLLLEGCAASTTLQQLELCLCQFESGTGHLWQEFVSAGRKQKQIKKKSKSSQLTNIQFYYPWITTATAKAKHNHSHNDYEVTVDVTM